MKQMRNFQQQQLMSSLMQRMNGGGVGFTTPTPQQQQQQHYQYQQQQQQQQQQPVVVQENNSVDLCIEILTRVFQDDMLQQYKSPVSGAVQILNGNDANKISMVSKCILRILRQEFKRIQSVPSTSAAGGGSGNTVVSASDMLSFIDNDEETLNLSLFCCAIEMLLFSI